MAQKRNYQKEMEEFFAQNKGRKLLLHCCCAPCATHCIACVEQEMDTTLYFYNPNIMMREEYEKRLSELQRYVCEAQCRIRGVVEGSYDNDFFLRLAAGRELEPEGGERCRLCISMRLEQTARYAAENGYELFGTTLTVSPHKDAEYINTAGRLLSERYGVEFLPSGFKKKEGFKHSAEISNKFNLYRQNYCGCRLKESPQGE